MFQNYTPPDPKEGDTYYDYDERKSYIYDLGRWEEMKETNLIRRFINWIRRL